jgi:hypothetical protein
MNNRTLVITAGLIVLMIAGALLYGDRSTGTNIAPANNASSTNGVPTASSTDSMTLAGGEVSLMNPSGFGLALNPAQILVSSYIPACDPDFDYCFYYNGDAYDGSNFEGAGLRIMRRADLPTDETCLKTPPPGYAASVKPLATVSKDAYMTSVFATGDAGAGHMASGDLYRLFVRQSSSCYEFETRIGSGQFANYPEGSIREFTEADRRTLTDSFKKTLDSVRLTSPDTAVQFPAGN